MQSSPVYLAHPGLFLVLKKFIISGGSKYPLA